MTNGWKWRYTKKSNSVPSIVNEMIKRSGQQTETTPISHHKTQNLDLHEMRHEHVGVLNLFTEEIRTAKIRNYIRLVHGLYPNPNI